MFEIIYSPFFQRVIEHRHFPHIQNGCKPHGYSSTTSKTSHAIPELNSLSRIQFNHSPYLYDDDNYNNTESVNIVIDDYVV